MARKPTFRQLLLSFLAVYEDVSHKELAIRAGLSPKTLSHHLRRTDLKEETLERLMKALRPRPAAVRIVTACVQALEELDRQEDLSEQDLEFIEAEALAAARRTREHLTNLLRRSRNLPDEGYPEAADLPAYRFRATRQWQRMEDLSEEMALVAVRTAPELQTWALCEKVCEESEKAASRSVERAAALARLAVEIAERVRGPEGWCRRVRGYAGAHGAKVLRVAGELRAADVGLMEAKELWMAGEDPEGVLDPGRLLDLETSLRRDQRQFDEARTSGGGGRWPLSGADLGQERFSFGGDGGVRPGD